ncbi:MAG: MBL fold metallo-hydrolase [Candidatus Eisenbacteria bacterium]|nr:MBL fold metallo-hydrolase [Candidatus Eisenbacteria bacterium]
MIRHQEKESPVEIHIFGARGSLPLGSRPSVYGGNTPCVACIARSGAVLVLDAGTGIFKLGRELADAGPRDDLFLLLSHVHWDHIQGFPFFAPAYDPRGRLHIMGGPTAGGTWEQALCGQMQHPYFPVPLSALHATLEFYAWPTPTRWPIGPFLVSRAPTNHPGGGFAYRVDCEGISVVYATDTEHFASCTDANLATLAAGADLLFYDSTYFPEEYDSHVGHGHSTWRQGVDLARIAGVRRLVLFHHEPSHEDESLADMGNQAAREFPNVWVAREQIVDLA